MYCSDFDIYWGLKLMNISIEEYYFEEIKNKTEEEYIQKIHEVTVQYVNRD